MYPANIRLTGSDFKSDVSFQLWKPEMAFAPLRSPLEFKRGYFLSVLLYGFGEPNKDFMIRGVPITKWLPVHMAKTYHPWTKFYLIQQK